MLSSIEVTSLPTKRNYIVGEAFDPAGMVVTATYDNGESSVITEYDYTPSGALTNENNIITVTYLNKTAEFTIVVSEKVVTGIAVTTAPTKRAYIEGQAFDPAGMVITATYNDASTVVVTDYTLSANAAALNTSDTKVTVTYAGKTATVDVTVEAKALTGIAVTAEPAKKAYIEGQAFDPAGMEITATYNDGETAAILDYTLSANADALSTSDTQVTVTYSGKTATVGITVEAKVVTGIAVTTEPAKKAYIEGQAFDPAGMVITATYNDGDSKVIPLKEGEADGYTISPTALALTDTEVTVTYAGKIATVEVSVEAKVVTSIAITTPPTAVIYINGTSFDPTGMVITATYNDGDSKVIPLKEGEADGYTYSPNDALTMDVTSVVIEYEGKTATQEITVSKDIVSISVTTEPTKKAYIEGQAFDSTGMVVSVLYTDNTSEPITSYTLSDNASELALGDTEITVTYLGQTAKVTVTVAEKTLTGISITTNPTKTKYVVGQAFNPAGMVVSAVYDNGKSEVISLKAGEAEGYTYSPVAALAITDTEVTISYSGQTAKVNITVEAKAVTSITVTNQPTKKSYIEGQAFDPAGMVITATYNDGDSKSIPLKNGEADGYTFSPAELAITDTKVTVTYDGKSADVTVSVIAKVLERITLTTAPSKTAYIEGQSFDPTGMVISAVYDNGKTEIIPLKAGDADGYTFNPNALRLGDSQVVVSYAGKIVTLVVTVEAKVVTGLTVTTQPTKKSYIEGQAFDPTGMVITATYNDGESKVITHKDGEADGYTCTPTELSVTDSKVTVTYGGKAVDVIVTVIAKVVTSLTVTKQPTKLVYLDGQTFDPAGMVVTATYNDGSSVVVTDYSIDTTTPLVSSDNVVSVAVTFGGKSANIEVQVGTVQSISIKTEPISVLYVTGEKFDAFGMVVVANLSCGAEYVLSYGEGGYSYSPTGELTKDVTKVTVSYGSFNAEQAITVKDGISVEAEDATVVSSSVKFLTDSPTASGGKYLGELRIGDELIGKFNASAEGKATVVFRAASGYILARNDSWQPTKMGNVQLNKIADITINGAKITIADDIVLEGGTSETGDNALWFNWTSVRFSDIPVKEGLNLLSFKFKNNDLTTCYGNPTTGNIDGFRIAFDDGITGEAVLAGVAEVKSDSELASIVEGKIKTTVEAEYGKFGGSTKTEGNGSLSGGFGVGGLEQLTLKVNYAEAQENAVLVLVAAPAWWTDGVGGNTAMKLVDHIGITVNGEFCHFGNLEIKPENKDSWWTLHSIVLSGVNLKAGENIIKIEKRTGGINIDCVNLYAGISGTIPSYNASLKGESESVVGTKTTLQAENGTLIDGTKLDGAGVGSLEALTLKVKYSAAQENATFVLAAAPAWWTQEVNGSTTLSNLNQHILMTINGVRVNFTDFTLTPENSGSWWTMYYIKISGVALDEGENIIHIRKLWGGLNIDYLDVFANVAGEEIVAPKN